MTWIWIPLLVTVLVETALLLVVNRARRRAEEEAELYRELSKRARRKADEAAERLRKLSEGRGGKQKSRSEKGRTKAARRTHESRWTPTDPGMLGRKFEIGELGKCFPRRLERVDRMEPETLRRISGLLKKVPEIISASGGHSDSVMPAPSPPFARGVYDDSAPVVGDLVDCTVFAPKRIVRGRPAMIQVIAHIPEAMAEAAMRAKLFDDLTDPRGSVSLGTRITHESVLTFELVMPPLLARPETRPLVWRGQTSSVQFALYPDKQFPLGDLLGTIYVSQSTIPIGQITFKLTVVDGESPPSSKPIGLVKRYKMAFISYAKENREEVLRCVRMLAPAGIKYFTDLLDLDPGDIWEEELYKRIDESDVMFLFWSTPAKESEWVEREWRYALLHKPKLGYIRPVLIEGPPPVPPPPDLAHLHFNDKVLYFLVGES